MNALPSAEVRIRRKLPDRHPSRKRESTPVTFEIKNVISGGDNAATWCCRISRQRPPPAGQNPCANSHALVSSGSRASCSISSQRNDCDRFSPCRGYSTPYAAEFRDARRVWGLRQLLWRATFRPNPSNRCASVPDRGVTRTAREHEPIHKQPLGPEARQFRIHGPMRLKAMRQCRQAWPQRPLTTSPPWLSGVSNESWTRCHDFILDHGATRPAGPLAGFPKSSLHLGQPMCVCHGIPGEKKLADGE